MKVSGYEDIQLIPNKCIVNNRSECDTTVTLSKHTFKMPIVSADMQVIIDETIAEFLVGNGYFYTMYRFDEIARIPLIKKMKKRGLITSINVSIKREEYSFIERLAEESLSPDYITIDVTHGHASSVTGMIQHAKKYLLGTFVIAGNVGTPEAVRELENAGADATKVGIGPGKVCTTKIKTGFRAGGWQLATLRRCAKAARKPVTADGGIRTYDDTARSVRFGATMVMIGSLFVGHEEPPGETKAENGIVYKEHFGSASEFQKGEKRNVEEKKIWIQHKGSSKDTLVETQQSFQPSISYTGGRDLESIQKVDYIITKNSTLSGDTIQIMSKISAEGS